MSSPCHPACPRPHSVILAAVLLLSLILPACSAPTAPPALGTATASPAASPFATPLPSPAPRALPPPPSAPAPTAAPWPSPSPTPDQEVRLPAELIARLGRGPIERLAASPDGKWIALASANQVCSHSASAMDFQEAWCGWVDTAPMSSIWSLHYRPDGKTIAASLWNGKIAILDATDGRRLQLINTHTDNVRSLAWSPDGKRLAAGSDGGIVTVWDPALGVQLQILNVDPSSLTGLAWSPDGRTLAAGTFFGKVVLWETSGFSETATFESPSQEAVSGLVWAPDGSRLYASSFAPYGCGEGCQPHYAGSVNAWDAAGGHLYSYTTDDPLVTIAISADGKLIAAGGEARQRLVVLEALNGGEVLKQGNTRALAGLGWLPGDRLVFPLSEKSLVFWEPETGDQTEKVLPAYDALASLAWRQDSKTLVAVSTIGSLYTWEAQTGQITGSEPEAAIRPPLALSPDGTALAFSNHKEITLLDLTTGKPGAALPISPESISKISWSPGGKRLAVLTQGQVMIWEIDGDRAHWINNINPGEGSSVDSMVWSPDGTRMAIGLVQGESPRLVEVDAQTGKELSTLTLDSNATTLAWSQSGLLALATGGWAEVWDLVGPKQVVKVTNNYGWGVESVALSSNGRLLASAAAEVMIRDTGTGKVLGTLEGHSQSVSQMVFSPDGRYLASLSDGQALLWDLAGLFP